MSMKTVEKLLFTVNTYIHDIETSETDLLDTSCNGLVYDPSKKMFTVVLDDIDTKKAADYLYPLWANLEECEKYGDKDKFFMNECVRSMKQLTEINRKWGSIEKYHYHVIHSLP